MLLGPVFRAELLRTARRRRYYVLRFFYGLLLLFIIWAGYEAEIRTASVASVGPGGELIVQRSSTVTIDQAARFAENMFIRFAVVQLVAILLLIPALFGGAIADEKQRKTLHYLMSSQLSSFEIVVDKVLGRAPHVAVFLALGLPVVCLLGLVGGVDPAYVVVAYAGTFSTASMAVALTVLVSTLSRKVRQAVLISYVLLLAWQFVPIIVYGAGSRLYPVAYSWIEPVNTLVGATSPLHVYVLTMMRIGAAGRSFGANIVVQVAWMAGLQLATAALMILIAVWRLRPTFRRHEATQARRTWFARKEGQPGRRRRWWDRPECGEDAMAWKERHFAGNSDIFTKLVVLPATILVSVFMALVVGVDETIPRAFTDLWNGGFAHWGSNGALVEHLRVISAWYVAIWLLAVAGASASSVAVEREEDTWISLTSTPLTGWEILRGKVLGAVWAQRGFAMVPLGFWTIGLVTGSVHPLGFLGAVVAFGVVSWMVVAVGVHASLRASSTSKALTSTIVTLAILYGYPIFLLVSFWESGVWDRYTSFVGLPSRVVVGPLVSYADFAGIWGPATMIGIRPIGLLLLGIYSSVAGFLTFRAVGRFDRWLDRPRMSGAVPILSKKPSVEAEVAEPALQS